MEQGYYQISYADGRTALYVHANSTEQALLKARIMMVAMKVAMADRDGITATKVGY